MNIDHHETLESLANHLVHDDCEHIFDEAKKTGIIDFDGVGGHCYDCTLAHLVKQQTKLMSETVNWSRSERLKELDERLKRLKDEERIAKRGTCWV